MSPIDNTIKTVRDPDILFAHLVNGNSLAIFSSQRGYGNNGIANYNANMVPLHIGVMPDVQM